MNSICSYLVLRLHHNFLITIQLVCHCFTYLSLSNVYLRKIETITLNSLWSVTNTTQTSIVRIVCWMSFSEGASHSFRGLHIFFSATHSTSVFSVSDLEDIILSLSLTIPFFAHLICTKVPDTNIEAKLRHFVINFWKFSKLGYLLFSNLSNTLKIRNLLIIQKEHTTTDWTVNVRVMLSWLG